MVAYHLADRPDSRLFRGSIFFLGGSTDLERPAPGVRQGDLSGIAAEEVERAAPPLHLPAARPGPGAGLGPQARRCWPSGAVREPITLVGGVPSWLLVLFERLLDLTGKSTIAEVWPSLEVVVHGGVKFDPYREAFDEVLGRPGDPAPGDLPLLRGVHRLRRPGDRAAPAGASTTGSSTSSCPVDELGSRAADPALAGRRRRSG